MDEAPGRSWIVHATARPYERPQASAVWYYWVTRVWVLQLCLARAWRITMYLQWTRASGQGILSCAVSSELAIDCKASLVPAFFFSRNFDRSVAKLAMYAWMIVLCSRCIGCESCWGEGIGNAKMGRLAKETAVSGTINWNLPLDWHFPEMRSCLCESTATSAGTTERIEVPFFLNLVIKRAQTLLNE